MRVVIVEHRGVPLADASGEDETAEGGAELRNVVGSAGEKEGELELRWQHAVPSQ